MSDDLKEAINQSFIYHESHGDDFRSDKQIETAYKYGFESGANWVDEHSSEVKEVDLDEEADNHWGVLSSDVRNSIYYNDYYKIAKHFFELGLKAQKGE